MGSEERYFNVAAVNLRQIQQSHYLVCGGKDQCIIHQQKKAFVNSAVVILLCLSWPCKSI